MSDASNKAPDWGDFLAEMEEVAEGLATDGWDVLTIVAGDATAVGPQARQFDTHGFAYVIPGNKAEAFLEHFEPGKFTRTEVFAAPAGAHHFYLTVLKDPDSQTAMLLSGAIEWSQLDSCKEAAAETGRMYTHVMKINGDHLGSFEHDDPEIFFPAGV